jgi:hypothetical protein
MSASIKTSFTIGLVLLSLGCFLPWQVEGDFLSFWTFGIRIFPSFEDNGGFLILLIAIVLVVLIFKPPVFIEKPERWIIAISIVLTLDSIFHIVKWIINLSKKIGIVGAPSIQIGLFMVFIGSITLLITSLLHYRKLPHEQGRQNSRN